MSSAGSSWATQRLENKFTLGERNRKGKVDYVD